MTELRIRHNSIANFSLFRKKVKVISVQITTTHNYTSQGQTALSFGFPGAGNPEGGGGARTRLMCAA